MPPPLVAELSTIDLEILKILWRSVFLEGALGSTTGDVQQKLREAGLERSKADIQRHHINKLANVSGLVCLVGKAQTNQRGGDKPNVYCINRLTTITWTSTAFMLVLISKRQQIERDVLIDELIHARIIDSATKKVVTPESLHEQINTSIAWQYISYVNKTVLWTMPRTDLEGRYLEFVAQHVELDKR